MKQFEYTAGRAGITITGYCGNSSAVVIPESIDGMTVSAIGKKAFLSRKLLRRVILPDSVSEIGDWAFAYCEGLESVLLPSGIIRFGRSVFFECSNLKKVEIEGKRPYVAPLLAAAVRTGAYYLLDTVEAGSEEWIHKWDSRMLSVLNPPIRRDIPDRCSAVRRIMAARIWRHIRVKAERKSFAWHCLGFYIRRVCLRKMQKGLSHMWYPIQRAAQAKKAGSSF
ncbi:MAG: leucine-rich repeat domain-containing protein [Lachnospiraceae bacterium]|nr:leucine-rich repeat domain-containing protein [Lachnospiraceae bacterium]